MASDIAKAPEPTMAQAGPPTDPPATTLPASDTSMALLDVEESPKPRTKLRLYLILTSIFFSLFLSALDGTIVVQSIPTICADLHSAAGYVWIGGAYLLGNATTGPIWAKCSDIWGRKIVFLAAITLFAVASIIAALSTNMPSLIAGRAIQGAAGGGMVQLPIIIISDLFSVRERSMYLGFTGFVWAIAGSSGPLIGGAFTQLATWRWCFWINLPICGIAFGLSVLFLDVNNPRTRLREGLKAIDWLGSLSLLAITSLILVGLDFGGVIFPWNSPKVICMIVFGVVAIGFFLFNEQRLAEYPLMPLGVFKNRSNNATFLIVVAHGMVLIGIEYYMPLYFQSVQQASPIRSGVLLLPLIIVQSVMEILAGYLIHVTGRYIEFIWAGSLFMTLGTGLYILFDTTTTVPVIAGLQILGALGPGVLFQPPTAAIQNSVSQGETAAATSALMFLRSISMSLSVVVGGVVFQNSMSSQQATLSAAGLSETVLKALSGSEAAANVGITKSVKDASQRQVVLDAFAYSMRNVFILYTALSAIAVVASVFVRHQNLNTEHTETKTGLKYLTKGKRAAKR